MTILPPNIRIFPFFLVISLTDKLVGRRIHVSALRQLSVFPLRGFIFNDIHKNKKGVRTIRATKYEKYMAGKFTREVYSLARKYTYQIDSSQKMAQQV